MATLYRLDYPGAIHHVYGRGNDKQAVFLDDEDRRFFISRLAKLKIETDLKIYAFCLMTNHYHLLPQTGDQSLGRVMGRLLSVYAARFHDRHGTLGYLFQGRYRAKTCARDAYFMRLLRYIHRNPVQAGMCPAPGGWKWSGHRQLAEGGAGLLDEELPLAFFGDSSDEARRGYSLFAGDAADDFSHDFHDEKPVLSAAGALIDVALEVASQFSLTLNELLSHSRKRSLTAAKLELLRRAEAEGHFQVDVARLLGCTSAALTQLRVRNKLIS